MSGSQSAATAVVATLLAKKMAEAEAMLLSRKRSREGALEPASRPEATPAPKQCASKGLMKGPSPSETMPPATSDRPKKKSKGAAGVSTANLSGAADEELVEIEDSSPPRLPRILATGVGGSRQQNPRRPRGDNPVMEAYKPPYILDRVDSAHDDPSVCMIVLQNAYLPANRETLAGRDFGLLASEMFMHLKKASDMALEYRNRTEHISNQVGGLQGFIDRATSATQRVLALEDVIEGMKKEASDLKGLLAREEEGFDALKEVAELEKERGEISVGRRHFKELAATTKEALTASQKRAKDQAQEFDSERDAWKARDAELERMVADSLKWGFEKCLGQITQKFPEHNIDLGKLDPLEPTPDEAPTEAGQEAAAEGEAQAEGSVLVEGAE